MYSRNTIVELAVLVVIV